MIPWDMRGLGAGACWLNTATFDEDIMIKTLFDFFRKESSNLYLLRSHCFYLLMKTSNFCILISTVVLWFEVEGDAELNYIEYHLAIPSIYETLIQFRSFVSPIKHFITTTPYLVSQSGPPSASTKTPRWWWCITIAIFIESPRCRAYQGPCGVLE